MSLTVRECLTKLKEKLPDLYPVWYVEDKGVYLVHLLKRGVSQDEAVSSFYAIDPNDGTIAGPVPVMDVLSNEDLEEKLDHPIAIDPEDRKPVKHFITPGASDFLIHYGIKGQKWGVRRFQNEDGTLTAEGKNRYGKALDTKGHLSNLAYKFRTKRANTADKLLNELDKDLSINREKSKKDQVDTKRVGLHTAYTLMNPMNVVNLVKDGIGEITARRKISKYLANRELKSDLDEKTGLRIKKDGAYNERADLAAVNPEYMDLTTNSKNNSMLCTTTYDMRQRGYDVTAQLDSQGYNFKDLKRWYPDVQIYKNTRRDENGAPLKQKAYVEKTIQALKKQGDGARGNLMMLFNCGCGQSIAYEIQNGKVILKDAQTGKIYTNPNAILNKTLTNSYARLDNVEPDLKRIKAECCR